MAVFRCYEKPKYFSWLIAWWRYQNICWKRQPAHASAMCAKQLSQRLPLPMAALYMWAERSKLIGTAQIVNHFTIIYFCVWGQQGRPIHHLLNAGSDLPHCLSCSLYDLDLLCVFYCVSFDAFMHVPSHQSRLGREHLSANLVHRILCCLIESKVVSYGFHWNFYPC